MSNMVLVETRSSGEGMFLNERAVQLEDFEGKKVTLFLSEDAVKKRGDANYILVKLLGESGDLALVRLPVEALEDRRTITVRRQQIQEVAA